MSLRHITPLKPAAAKNPGRSQGQDRDRAPAKKRPAKPQRHNRRPIGG
ncbi:hypothetical protein [Streptomyces sp. NPDC093109]